MCFFHRILCFMWISRLIKRINICPRCSDVQIWICECSNRLVDCSNGLFQQQHEGECGPLKQSQPYWRWSVWCYLVKKLIPPVPVISLRCRLKIWKRPLNKPLFQKKTFTFTFGCHILCSFTINLYLSMRWKQISAAFKLPKNQLQFKKAANQIEGTSWPEPLKNESK